jgi:signal transduction histidine kinase/DNA-binding response OmpR family regulator
MNATTLVILLAFGLLFLSTLVTYLRRRDALSRDVMLIFASVAALLGVMGLGLLVGDVPEILVRGAIALLLAQPLFTLRVAHRLRPVRGWMWAVAGGGYALTTLPLLILPQAEAGPMLAPAVTVFVLIDLVAAFYLAREARRRVGSARIRLACAATASASLALALGLLVFSSDASVLDDAGRLLALVAAGLYLLAFMPPWWLRRLWNALATYAFTNELIDAPPGETPAALWSRTAEVNRRLTGARAAMVLAGAPPRAVAVAGDTVAGQALAAVHLPDLPAAHTGQRPLTSRDGPIGTVATALGAPYVSAIHFDEAGDHGSFVLFHPRPSLFAADDHLIVQALTRRAVVFAERSAALAEQAALADRLTLTVQALEQASQAKSDFLASMSHELRTPLSAIIGFSALMRDEPLEDERRSVPDEWVQHIHRSGDHLLALINDVLDLTKIEAGRIELHRESFDLAAALAESVEGLRPLAERKGIAVELDAERGAIEADRGRLRQIVYNLLSNAIKFTPDGGHITLEARWNGDDACIVVSDTGVGILPDDLARVFEEFSQVGDIKAREAGTGLGLALTKRLVEAHGGEIHVSSQPGHGSRFEVRLIGTRAELTAPDEAPALVVHDTDSTTVLLIEDDPGAVRLLRTYLEAEGYRVIVSTDGEAGIAAAREEQPAAIVLDVLLPGIDGWEVLRRLKADADLRDVPVVVVTVVDEREIAMSLGAVDYFLKPIRPGDLLARLGQYTFTTKVKQRPVRVLAIDDDPATRDLVASTLRAEGFDVVVAGSGAEALGLAAGAPPELVICDLLMPDMDGYEVVNRLHANVDTRDATILILTGQELTDADRERLNGKVADILAKGDELRPRLAKWLERAAAATDRRRRRVVEPPERVAGATAAT